MQLLAWGGTVQGCWVPAQLSTLDVEFPWVGTVTLQHLGHSQGNSTAAQLSSVPLLPAPMLQSAFLCFRAFRTSYARGELGLNLVLFRVVIAEAHSPWEVKAVSPPDCSLSCPSGCSLPRCQHFEILHPVQQQGRCFSDVSSPLPSLPSLC